MSAQYPPPGPQPPYGPPPAAGPGQFSPQQYPPAPARPRFPGGEGELVLNLRKPSGLGSASMITPEVRIDGFPAGATWERNSFTVPAGRRQLLVQSHYLWAFGQAQIAVEVGPGQTVELYYASPLITFIGGAIGYQPQERPGKLFFLVVMSLLALFLVGVILLAVVNTS